MSMSTHLEGIKPADDKWYAMQKVYEACEKADVEVPKEVEEFFEYERPDPRGVVVDLIDEGHRSVGEISEEGQTGYEVVLAELPEDIKILRFYNSW